jgi:hypothetical protein
MHTGRERAEEIAQFVDQVKIRVGIRGRISVRNRVRLRVG